MDHVTYYVRFYLRIEIKYCFHFLKESHMTSSLHLSTYFKELGKNHSYKISTFGRMSLVYLHCFSYTYF